MSYTKMLADLICKTYQVEIKDADSKEWPFTKALQVVFRANYKAPNTLGYTYDYEDDSTERYHRYDLLIWGAMNYTGVFLRDRLMHPEETSDWFLLSYHDSCWREDGVQNFLSRAEPYIGGFSPDNIFGHPFKVIELTEECIKDLQSHINKRDYDKHPIFSKEF